MLRVTTRHAKAWQPLHAWLPSLSKIKFSPVLYHLVPFSNPRKSATPASAKRQQKMDVEEELETLGIRRNSLKLIQAEDESSTMPDHNGSTLNEKRRGEMERTGLYCWTGFVFLSFVGLVRLIGWKL